MKRLIGIFFFFFLTSCTTTIYPENGWEKVDPTEGISRVIYIPNLNDYTRGKLGNSLVSKSTITERPAIQLLSNTQVRGGIEVKITPEDNMVVKIKGTAVNKITGETAECFHPWSKPYEQAPEIINMICIVDNRYIANWNSLVWGIEDQIAANKNTKYKKLIVEDESGFYFKQEFIYNGRVNNSLKFVYREFSGDTARPSFTQEVQYDLNQSSIIGFKDLSMEILKATNQEIEYRVITPF